MTVEDLMYFLEEKIGSGEIDNETEIRLAMQPSYPMEHTIREAVLVDGTIYLSEHENRGYLQGDVRAELNW